MKTKFLQRVLWLVIPLLSIFSSSAWGAADYTYTLASGDFTTSVHQKTSGTFTWTASNFSGAESYGWDATYGFKFGSGKSSYPSAFKLTSSSSSSKIKKVVVTANVNSSKSCKLNVKVGSTTYGSQATINTKKHDTWEFSIADASAVTGAIELSFSSNTGPLYLEKIEVYYLASGTSVSLTGTVASGNGTITLSPASSVTTTSAAQDVTVTASPAAGYYLSNLTATNPTTGTATVAGDFSKVTYSKSANGSSTITATFSPIWQLRGDFNSWGTTDPLTTYSAGVATITKSLSAMTKYEFKMYNVQESAYYKNTGKIITDISGWDYSSGDGANTCLYTGPAGTYTFKFTLEGRLLQVIYPEVDHPSAGYAYFQQQGGWSACRIYQWDTGGGELTSWENALTISNTANICGTTYYYFALANEYNRVKFRDNGVNQGNELATSGYSGKYTGNNFSSPAWNTFTNYTITFAGNGNTGGSMSNVSCISSGSNQTLAANAFTKTNYTFTGWKADVNVTIGGSTVVAGTLIEDESTIQNITSDITLTAQWQIVADHYIDNIWGVVTADQTGTYTRPTLSDQSPGGLTDCQHLHYHFVGWITKAKYDAGTTIDARTTPAGDLVAGGSVTANGSTYYAVWEKAAAGGGGSSYTLVTDASVLSAGDKLVFASSDETSAYLLGYQKSNNRGVSESTTITSNSMTPTVATLNSETAKAFVIDLEGSSGSWYLHDAINGYLQATGGTSSNYLTCNNSNSRGNNDTWTIAVNSTTHVATIKTINTTTNNRGLMQYNSGSSLYACYATASQSDVYIFRKPGVTYEDPIATCGEEYTITIDKNNASATCTSCGAKVTANATTLSNLVAPTWTGHDVDYYMVASADNSTKIAEANGALAASVTSGTPWTDSNGKWVKGGDATIYAKWKYAEYEIAYYDQGGGAFSGVHGDGYPTTHTYNTATALVNPTKNGYNFAGWYTASDCSTGLVTSLGATAYTSGPINLYAKWTLKTYDVTWVVNGTTVATQTSVTYGTTYEDLSSTPSNPADNALADCGSDKFIGWVTAEYTAEGGTKALQYDPYAVTNSTTIDDTHHTFYAMFAKESGTAFSLSVTSGDFKISGLVGGVNYYATGALSSGQYGVTTTASDGDLFTFTKVSDGVYTILHKRSSKYVKWNSSTNFKEETTAENWTITAASHGSWCVVPAGATTRAFVMNYSNSNPASNSVFKPYAQTNVTNTPAQYYYVEIGTSNLTNYRTGCCSETITLTVSDATSGAGGTVAMKWNNASKSSGDAVSTCSTGTLVVDVTANPSYTLTAITIAGTNKTITLDPADLTTGLPSTSKMTYTVTVPSLATGTLTITPTFTRTYSVTYNLDGGETAGSTAVANYQSGATVALVTPNPTKSGYDFTGWTVTKDGGGNVSVSAGQFTMPTDNVTVTAGWSAKTLSSISVTPTTAEVYVGQYVQIPVTYDPADILTKGYTLVSTPGYCVTTGSTNTTLKITGGRGGVTITSTQVETVSIKATADNTKTASVTVTVKPLPVDHFVDLVHVETFADQAASIVDNNLSTAYTAPGHADVDAPLEGNDCEKQHLHLVGWIESEWANAHLTATMSEITSAEDNEHNPLFFEVYAPMNVSGKTYYAVWGKEVTP